MRTAVLAVALLVVAGLLLARDGLLDPLGLAPGPGPAATDVAAAAALGPCRVRRVIDGDTLDVDCGAGRERVRLLRVDTPERQEPGYGSATRALRRLVGSGPVTLAFEDPRPERDDHGRLLAYVYVGETHVNVEMVRAGWSRFWTRYGRGRLAREFEAAEDEARQAIRGLWAPDARRP